VSATSARRALPLAVTVAAIIAAGFLPVSLPAGDTVVPAGGIMRPVGEIAAGVTVTEQFPAAANAIASISLFLATYQRVNRGTLRITLLAERDGQWQQEAVRQVDTATLGDNAYYTLAFSPPLPLTKGQPVRITLQSDSRPGASVTWWRNPEEQRQGYLLTMNGHALPGNAVFQVSYAPESGRLFAMIGEIWKRGTVFLNPVWQGTLILGLAILAASVFALTRRLDEA